MTRQEAIQQLGETGRAQGALSSLLGELATLDSRVVSLQATVDECQKALSRKTAELLAAQTQVEHLQFDLNKLLDGASTGAEK